MRVIGVTGSPAAGKSTICDLMESWGAVVLRADQIGHQVLKEPEVKEALVRRWGPEILDCEGNPDRAAIARRVFAPGPQGDEDRRFLEQLVHPRIGQRLAEQLDRLRRAPQPPKAAVVDAALLCETGWDRYCDHVVVVDAPAEVRHERIRQRGGDPAQWRQREAAQWPVPRKAQHADLVLQNDGPLEETARTLRRWWDQYVSSC